MLTLLQRGSTTRPFGLTMPGGAGLGVRLPPTTRIAMSLLAACLCCLLAIQDPPPPEAQEPAAGASSPQAEVWDDDRVRKEIAAYRKAVRGDEVSKSDRAEAAAELARGSHRKLVAELYKIVVGDPALARTMLASREPGAPDLTPCGDDWSAETQARFDAVASRCREAGYAVARVPVVPGRDGRTFVTYTNVILDDRPGGRVCYILDEGPTYSMVLPPMPVKAPRSLGPA